LTRSWKFTSRNKQYVVGNQGKLAVVVSTKRILSVSNTGLRSEFLLFFRVFLLVVQEVPAMGACVRGSCDKPLKKVSVEGVDFIGVMKVSFSRRIKYAESFSIPGSP